MLISFMNKIYLFFIFVCCVQSYLLPLSYRLWLRFSLPLIKITARIDRPQTQRNWQNWGLKFEIHQSPLSKRSGLLHLLLAAKWRARNSLFGLNFRTHPHLTVRKNDEKTKFWGQLVESAVFQITVIEWTFDHWIEAELT